MIPLLDTHQHLVYANDLSYGWTAGVPALGHRAFTLEDYKALTAGKAVESTLFMEASADDHCWASEAPFIADIAKQPGSDIAGLIATCRPESDIGFDAELEKADALGIVGYRRILHVVDDAVSQSENFRSNVRKVGAAGKVFDMCFSACQLPLARDLAAACDATTLVLDHCGVPDSAGGGLDPWRADISALAQLPHVNCKLSGILAYCKADTASLAVIQPMWTTCWRPLALLAWSGVAIGLWLICEATCRHGST